MIVGDRLTFTKVRLPHGWLGNMAPFSVVFDGKPWRTTEALFQFGGRVALPEVQALRSGLRDPPHPRQEGEAMTKRYGLPIPLHNIPIEFETEERRQFARELRKGFQRSLFPRAGEIVINIDFSGFEMKMAAEFEAQYGKDKKR